MKNISKITIIAGILTIASYCSGKSNIQVAAPGSEIKAPADATSVAARVLADSGATLSIGTSVQLTVPAGALPADTDISIEKKGIPPQQETLVPVAASLEFGAHGTEFNKPVALNVCYDAARLAAQGIKEETVAVYYVDPATGEYASIGGSVNKASHCVTADLQHFSTYLVAAQILQGGNNAPVISAPTLLPTTPMAGLPLRFSTVITDFEQNTVNGQVGFGQIATARLFYRIYQGDVNAAAYTEVGLTPDYNDATATRFTAKIPASAVTTAGLEYYIRAADNLGLVKLRYPVKVPNQPSIAITSTATGLSFQTNVVTDLAAGFKRSYTVKGNSNLGGSYNVEVESFAVNNGIGTATQLSSAVVQFTATTAGAQSSRTGSLTVNSGAFSLTSLDIRVHAGVLDHIALLSPTGVVLGNTITVNANSTYDFDVLGYDAFGNTSNVLPLFVLVPVTGAGTISPTGLYTAPATAQTATLVATLDGVQDSILINVVPAIPMQTVVGVVGGGLSHAFTSDMSHDLAGNAFVAGYTSGTFDGHAPIGTGDAFLVKYDVTGAKSWSVREGNVGSLTSAYGTSTDSLGNIYLTGTAFGNLNGEVNPLGVALFVIKYSPSGLRLWTKLMTDVASISSGFKSCSDSSGVYITGQAIGSFDGQPVSSGQDFMLVKYDFNGNRIWTRIMGSQAGSQSQALGCEVSGAGYVHVTGQVVNGTTFDGQFIGTGGILVKFDSAGARVWSRVTSNGYALNVALDSYENAIVTGYFYGQTIGDQILTSYGSQNGFVIKFDSDGNVLWTRANGYALGGDVAVDSAGGIYVTGAASADLDGFVNPSGNAQYVKKYMPNGSVAYVVFNGATNIATRGDALYIESATNKIVTVGYINGPSGSTFFGQSVSPYFQVLFTKF